MTDGLKRPIPGVPGVKRRTEPQGNPIVPPHVRAQTAGPVVELPDEVTGQHEGEDLARLRARRPTEERIGRLEVKHDALAKDVTETRVIVGDMAGQLKVLPKLIDEALQSVHASAAREHVTFTAQVDVAKAGQLATIADTADAKKTRRALIAKAVAGAAALLTSGAVIHALLEKL